MRALVYKGPFQMEFEEIEYPQLGPADIIVKVRSVGMCGSDIHGFSGKTGRRSPGMVMGHEIAGEVVELGTKVQHVEKGQKVVIQPIISCGKCTVCKEGKTSICLNKKMIGVNMGTIGGLSEYLAVPKENAFPISQDIPYTLACLVEPFAVGVGAVRNSPLRKGQVVLIVGAGVIGLTILLMAREKNPQKIFIVDNNPRKLGIAKNLGAIPVNFTQNDPVAVVLQETNNIGADISFEAVGLSASVRTAMYATRPGGTVTWVGNSQKIIELDMQDVVVKAKNIQGVYCYTDDDFSRAITFVDHHRDLASIFVEKEVSFEQACALFMQLAKLEIEILRGVTLF
jgi:L-iditol 2-dehydrogenase